MKLLLTGRTGQVGWELRRTLATLGPVDCPTRSTLDLSDSDAIRSAVRSFAPDVIVNAGAHTAVDRAEEETDVARAVNARAPGILAEEAARTRAVLVHFSTDYVFNGQKSEPYVEEDPPCPLNVYGRTKLAGEKAIRATGADHLILRTSWVYGLRRRNFVTKMLKLLQSSEEVSVVDDQVGCPTWCRFLAQSTAQVLTRFVEPGSASPLGSRSGTYHLAGAGSTSWYGFASAIRRKIDGGTPGAELTAREIRPVSTSEFPRPAARPRNSTLSSEKARRELGLHVVPWEHQLSMCLEEALA